MLIDIPVYLTYRPTQFTAYMLMLIGWFYKTFRMFRICEPSYLEVLKGCLETCLELSGLYVNQAYVGQ